MARRMVIRRRSREIGFSMKSKAPNFTAVIAVEIVAWPEIMITWHSGAIHLSRFNTSMPSIPGIQNTYNRLDHPLLIVHDEDLLLHNGSQKRFCLPNITILSK